MTTHTGTFITLEGPEGSGKSTQTAMLAERLRAVGNDVLTTREPGGEPFADEIRRLLLDPATHVSPTAELFGFLTARANHVDSVILPALAQGKVVICDRFIDSTVAYQGGYFGVETVCMLNGMVINNCMPNITFLIKVDPLVGLSRVQTVTKFEERPVEYHRQVWSRFEMEAERNPQRIVIINGEQSKDMVHSDILGGLVEHDLETLLWMQQPLSELGIGRRCARHR